MVGLLGGVLVILFLGLAGWNSRRMEQTLLQVQIGKASSFIESLERLSGEFLRSLQLSEGWVDTVGAEGSWFGSGASLQEALAGALVELARELDEAEMDGGLDPEKLAALAANYSLRAVFFLDGKGEVVYSYGPLVEQSLVEARKFLAGGDVVSIRFVFSESDSENLSCVLVKRQNLPGVIFLALDREDLFLWRAKVSLQEAMTVAGWIKGILYIMVRDDKGVLWAQGGEVPQRDELRAGLRPSWRWVGGRKALEVSLSLGLGEISGLEAVVGLDPSEMEELLARNRLQIYLSTAMMAVLALIGVVVLNRTQSKHHARLQELNQRLHQSQRLMALGRLARVVAHEVRNPLNAISMAVQRLGRDYAPAEENPKEEFSRLVRVIRSEVQRINRIVEEFLGLTRKGDLQVQEIPVGELLDRLAVLIQEQAASKGTRVTVSRGDQEPTVTVDPDRMMQALLNLALNALDAVSGQGGAIRLGCRAGNRNRVVLEIQDNGKGMPPEETARIFEPGYSTKWGGLGLGLHIAREIVRVHGGEITVRSEEGKGTTFSVFLPCSGVSHLGEVPQP